MYTHACIHAWASTGGQEVAFGACFTKMNIFLVMIVIWSVLTVIYTDCTSHGNRKTVKHMKLLHFWDLVVLFPKQTLNLCQPKRYPPEKFLPAHAYIHTFIHVPNRCNWMAERVSLVMTKITQVFSSIMITKLCVRMKQEVLVYLSVRS